MAIGFGFLLIILAFMVHQSAMATKTYKEDSPGPKLSGISNKLPGDSETVSLAQEATEARPYIYLRLWVNVNPQQVRKIKW